MRWHNFLVYMKMSNITLKIKQAFFGCKYCDKSKANCAMVDYYIRHEKDGYIRVITSSKLLSVLQDYHNYFG